MDTTVDYGTREVLVTTATDSIAVSHDTHISTMDSTAEPEI